MRAVMMNEPRREKGKTDAWLILNGIFYLSADSISTGSWILKRVICWRTVSRRETVVRNWTIRMRIRASPGKSSSIEKSHAVQGFPVSSASTVEVCSQDHTVCNLAANERSSCPQQAEIARRVKQSTFHTCSFANWLAFQRVSRVLRAT